MSSLLELSGDISSLVRQASQFVVAVGGGTRFGSAGVVWKPGVIVTTDHTLRQDEDIRVTAPNSQVRPATLAGRDPGTDLAVLRFEGDSGVRPEATAPLEAGRLVVAVGRSADTGPNAALGIISAIGKPWRTWQGGRLDSYIRLDLTLYPGSSGAVVLDAAGAVVGLATPNLSRIAPVAIPAATIDRVAGEILLKGAVARPYLGVAVQPVPLPPNLAGEAGAARRGLIVLTADPKAPAGKAGLLVGDVILSLDDSIVGQPGELQNVLSSHAPGDRVRVRFLRGGKLEETEVILEDRAGRAE